MALGLPRLKEWATAGSTIALSSAAAAHLFAGDSLADALPPLGIRRLGLIREAMHPDSRRLPSSAVTPSSRPTIG